MSKPTDAFDSRVISRRMMLTGLAGAFAASAAYGLEPRATEHRLARWKLGDLIPIAFGRWRYGSPDRLIVARPDDELPNDGYDQLVGRTYESNNGSSIMLLVAYGSTQGATLQLHRPETCYPGQGFQLSSFAEADYSFGLARPVEARRFTATRDERIERLVYWTRIANSFPRNTAGEYRAILGSVLRGLIPDGVLVRVSTITPNIAAADDAIDEFVTELVRSMATPGRQILLGDTIAAGISEMASAHKG